MKAVTIGKIARLMVIIAVVVILAIPTFAGVESFKINAGASFVETESIYELGCMTDSDLASNIEDVTKGEPKYMLVPQDENGKKYTPEEVPTSGLETFAATFKTKYGNGTATLLDPDGNVAKQQTITGRDGMTQYVFTGVKLTESLVNMVTLKVALESVIYEKRSTISDVDMEKRADSYRIKVEIPYLLFATALADGKHSKIGIAIGVDYNSFFDVKVRLDMPLERFMDTASGGEIHLPECNVNKATSENPIVYDGPKTEYAGVDIQEEIVVTTNDLDLSGIEGQGVTIGNFGGSDGGVRLEVRDDGKIKVMTDDDAGLIEAFKQSREEDGSLVINLDEGDPIVVTSEQMDSLLSMVDELLADHPEIAEMYGIGGTLS